MADASAAPKKRTFRKFEYRGIDLDKILKLSENELYDLFRARCRRHRARVGNKPQYLHLVEKCVKSKEGLEPGMKPNPVKTHLRDAIIVPAMIGAIVAVHNGKTFTGVEIKPEMIGRYLGEFSITYKPVQHGRPGIGATHSSRFVPLK